MNLRLRLLFVYDLLTRPLTVSDAVATERSLIFRLLISFYNLSSDEADMISSTWNSIGCCCLMSSLAIVMILYMESIPPVLDLKIVTQTILLKCPLLNIDFELVEDAKGAEGQRPPAVTSPSFLLPILVTWLFMLSRNFGPVSFEYISNLWNFFISCCTDFSF